MRLACWQPCMAKRHWLFKSEPEAFSIDDLAKAKDQTTFWDGIRNYQARNLLRDEIQSGDLVLFYHSNANPAAVVGTATVVKQAQPDPTQFNPASTKHDPKATKDDPRWYGVDIQFVSKFKHPVTLDTIKNSPQLGDMVLVKRSRLSIQPVHVKEFERIVKMGAKP